MYSRHLFRYVQLFLPTFCCSQGMVEKWLIQVEDVMVQSLMAVTEEAVTAYANTPRERWVKQWPGQVINRRA